MKTFQQKVKEYIEFKRNLGCNFIEVKTSLAANNLFRGDSNSKYILELEDIPVIVSNKMNDIKLAFSYRDKNGILKGELLDSRFKVPGVD